MLTEIWKAVKGLINLVDDLVKCQTEIRDIRHDLIDLTMIVHNLATKIEHTKELAAGERENMLLEIENRILLLEQRLNSPSDRKETKKRLAHKQETPHLPKQLRKRA